MKVTNISQRVSFDGSRSFDTAYCILTSADVKFLVSKLNAKSTDNLEKEIYLQLNSLL